jgi:hypothetical protein
MWKEIKKISIEGHNIGLRLYEFDLSDKRCLFWKYYECDTMQNLLDIFVKYLSEGIVNFRDMNCIPTQRDSFEYCFGSYNCYCEEGEIKWNIHFNSRTLTIFEYVEEESL